MSRKIRWGFTLMGSIKHNFMKREPGGTEWEPVEDMTDPVVVCMTALDTNYLQYTVSDAQRGAGKRGQVRWFRERVYADE